MDVGYVIVMIIAGILTLAINFWIADEFYEVAKMKGYTDSKYFIIPFLFTFIGYILVAALPSKKMLVTNVDNNSTNELPDL